MALTLSGLGRMPIGVRTWPRYSTDWRRNLHLEGLSFKPALATLSITAPCLKWSSNVIENTRILSTYTETKGGPSSGFKPARTHCSERLRVHYVSQMA